MSYSQVEQTQAGGGEERRRSTGVAVNQKLGDQTDLSGIPPDQRYRVKSVSNRSYGIPTLLITGQKLCNVNRTTI